MVTVYSKLYCPGCDKLKAQYIREGIEFEEVILGVDITVDEFLSKYPEVKSVPYVVKD